MRRRHRRGRVAAAACRRPAAAATAAAAVAVTGRGCGSGGRQEEGRAIVTGGRRHAAGVVIVVNHGIDRRVVVVATAAAAATVVGHAEGGGGLARGANVLRRRRVWRLGYSAGCYAAGVNAREGRQLVAGRGAGHGCWLWWRRRGGGVSGHRHDRPLRVAQATPADGQPAAAAAAAVPAESNTCSTRGAQKAARGPPAPATATAITPARDPPPVLPAQPVPPPSSTSTATVGHNSAKLGVVSPDSVGGERQLAAGPAQAPALVTQPARAIHAGTVVLIPVRALPACDTNCACHRVHLL